MPNQASNKRHPIRGYFYIAAATLCWDISAVMGKAVFTGRMLASGNGHAIDALVLSQTRTTIAFLMLAPALLLLRGRSGLALPRADAGRSLLVGAAGISASNYFYYLAITKTTIAVAITLQYLSPVLVLLYMVMRGKQRATASRVGGVLLAVVGAALVIGLGQGQVKFNAAGVAAGLAAAIGFSFYNVGGASLLERQDRWTVFTYSMLGSALMWAVVNPPWRFIAARYNAAQWGFIVCFSVVSILFGYSFYYAGLAHLDATRAVVTSCLEPVFVTLIAFIVLGEAITLRQGFGVLVVLMATILVQLPERTAGTQPAASA